MTCVNKFNLNENILTLHSAQGLASVVTINSKTALSDRRRGSRDDWGELAVCTEHLVSVSQSKLRAGSERM